MRLVPSLGLALAGITSLSAMDHQIVGARALGMGGTTVASVRDSTAQFYNPGMLGFFGLRPAEGFVPDDRVTEVDEDEDLFFGSDNNQVGMRDFSVQLDLQAGYRVTEDLVHVINELNDIDFDALSDVTLENFTQEDIELILRAANLINTLENPENQVHAFANGGVGVQIGHFAIGARAFGSGVALVNHVDTTNIGLDNIDDIDDLSNEIVENSAAPGDWQNQHINSDLEAELINAGFSNEAVSALDYELDQLISSGVIPTSQIEEIIDLLNDLAAVVEDPTSGGSWDDNQSSVLWVGLGYAELPISYGYAINEHLSLGLSLKYMQGRVYGLEVLVLQDDFDEIMDNGRENYQESETFGIDVGLAYRSPNFQFGLTGRNLNSPEFDGFYDPVAQVTYPDQTLDPELVAGVAWIPWRDLTLEVNADLLATESTQGGYEHQNLALGAEWDAWRFLALRGGAYQNLAEDDVGPVVSLGLGLNLYAVRLDLAGAFSLKQGEYDGEDIPGETRLALALATEW